MYPNTDSSINSREFCPKTRRTKPRKGSQPSPAGSACHPTGIQVTGLPSLRVLPMSSPQNMRPFPWSQQTPRIGFSALGQWTSQASSSVMTGSAPPAQGPQEVHIDVSICKRRHDRTSFATKTHGCVSVYRKIPKSIVVFCPSFQVFFRLWEVSPYFNAQIWEVQRVGNFMQGTDSTDTCALHLWRLRSEAAPTTRLDYAAGTSE